MLLGTIDSIPDLKDIIEQCDLKKDETSTLKELQEKRWVLPSPSSWLRFVSRNRTTRSQVLPQPTGILEPHFVGDAIGAVTARDYDHAESFLSYINSLAPDLKYFIEHPKDGLQVTRGG
eukprot:sb/3476363/